MKKLIALSAVVAMVSLSGPAFARIVISHSGNGNSFTSNTTTNTTTNINKSRTVNSNNSYGTTTVTNNSSANGGNTSGSHLIRASVNGGSSVTETDVNVVNSPINVGPF